METIHQSSNRNKIIIISAALVIGFALHNIILGSIALTYPLDSSEFGALRNFALTLYDFLIIIFSVLTLISGVFLLKVKRWAYITSIIYITLLIFLLAFSDLKEIVFDLSPGAALSLNHEIFPVLVLIILVLSIKQFWEK